MENKFLDAMNFRFAAKEFDENKKISEETFANILEFGRLSPSSFGYEPWRFLVIQNENLRKKMKEFTWGAQNSLPSASHFVIILARKDVLASSKYIEYIDKDIHKIPDEIFAFKNKLFDKFQKTDFELTSDKDIYAWSCKQCYIALANMMSGASYLGIDSCPIEGFDIKLTTKFIKDELKIDTDKFGVCVMLAFGYRKQEPKRKKTRQQIKDIAQWYN